MLPSKKISLCLSNNCMHALMAPGEDRTGAADRSLRQAELYLELYRVRCNTWLEEVRGGDGLAAAGAGICYGASWGGDAQARRPYSLIILNFPLPLISMK